LLSQRFKATLTDLHDDKRGREELRPLPKPIYRYKLGESKDTHPNLIDDEAFVLA
jgi:hypothetical protein